MNKLLCVLLSCGLVAACAVEDGTPGQDGLDGKDGVDGATGETGETGTDGSNGSDGSDGSDGMDGQDGVDGSDGADGQDGTDGSDGSDGSDGQDGSDGSDGQDGQDGQDGASWIACGDELIAYEDWLSTCGSDVGECVSGYVTCDLFCEGGPQVVCQGEVEPAQNSGVCYRDADCDGAMDDVSGTGANVTLVQQNLVPFVPETCQLNGVTVTCSTVGGDSSLALPSFGLCRNASKSCKVGGGLLGTANHVDVELGDFTAAALEGNLGEECSTGLGQPDGRLRCVVADGTASVQCVL